MSQIDDHYDSCPGDECARHGCPPDPYEVALSDPEKGAALDALTHFGEDEPTGETMPIEAVALMGALMEQSGRESAYITNQLLDSYKRDAEDARAELAAVREGIYDLLDQPWTPATHTLIAALRPPAEYIEHFRRSDG